MNHIISKYHIGNAFIEFVRGNYLVRAFFRRKPSSQPVFVMGCYRSGKTTLLNILQHSMECSVFHETNSAAYYDFRIRSEYTIRELIERSHRKLIVFELVNDVQYADRFLGFHPGAKAIWIYRNYEDVLVSAIKDWDSLWRDIIIGICRGCNGRLPEESLISERMNPVTLSLLKEACKEDISREDGAALLWYARNQIYFDLHLEGKENVLLAKYEEIIDDPLTKLKVIFDFISCPFNPRYTAWLHPCERPDPKPFLSEKVKLLCDEMMGRLDSLYALRMMRANGGRRNP